MSYCRFSSNNFKSDVYIYDDVNGGITMHVAGSRHVADTPIPVLPSPTPENKEAFMAAYEAQNAWLDKATLQKIDLPHAGSTFHFNDYEDVIKKLAELKKLGYMIPEGVVDALAEEAEINPLDSALQKAKKAVGI